MQVDITGKMRTILVDWLIEVHMKYRLRAETLHLTINLVDRYISRTAVMRKRLQLVGVVSMFIASKFEEINPPEVRDWVYITDNAYTKDEVLQMECHMLTTLSFQIVVPTAAQFFDFLPKANGCDDAHSALAQYIIELGLLDIRMLQHTPSHVVSAALLLSNKLLKRNVVWPASMVQESRHGEIALAGCVEELRQLLEADQAGEGGQLRAVHKKFSCVDRHSVAKRDYRN
jgi:cyclin B